MSCFDQVAMAPFGTMCRLLVSSVALTAWLVACSAKNEPTPIVADGGGVGDAGAQAAGSCALSGDQCVGATGCCAPRVGFLVDVIRKCRSATPTALACDARPSGTTHACGGASEESSCVSRTSDAGADGGIEVYYTNVNFGVPAGFGACDQSFGGYPNCP